MINEKIFYKNPNRPIKCIRGKPFSANNSGVPMHFHPELEFLIIEAGRMKNRLEGEEHVTQSGDIIFFNKGIPHATQPIADGTVQHMIQFKIPSTFRGALRYLSDILARTVVPAFVFHPDDADYADLSSHLVDMIEQYDDSSVAADYRTTSDIYYVISLLHRRGILADERAAFDFNRLQRLVPLFEYIDSHFFEPISLDYCAELLRLNKSYLSRLFRNSTGITLWDFINFVRVSKSEEMLAGNMNLTEVAYAAGFSSPSYFHRTFRRYKQLSPSEYRRLYRGDGLM
ncbi:MAG: helix-turn-helix transcriptional regulator [Clostridia bacterium]|nr:helix-turn-helix transcriptional regulator [Clostridia bacterium]